jgi:hypothetical protein
MKLAGLGAVDTYEAAASALESAGLRRDGIPMGQTWRVAAKLSDSDLMSAIVRSDEEIFGRERIEY